MPENEPEPAPPPSEPIPDIAPPPSWPPPATPQTAPPPQAWPPPPPPASWPPPPATYGGSPYVAPPVNSVVILTLGISGLCLLFLGLLCFPGGIVAGGLGIAAWIMGNQALATLDRVGDPLAQRGAVVAGRVCGIIATILAALGLVGAIGFFVYAMVTTPSH